jgi:hypothetical protein
MSADKDGTRDLAATFYHYVSQISPDSLLHHFPTAVTQQVNAEVTRSTFTMDHEPAYL